MNDLSGDIQLHARPMADTPELAVSGILNAMLKLGPRVSRGQQRAVLDQLVIRFDLSQQEALDLAVMGNWLASRPESPAEALYRLTNELGLMTGSAARAAYDSLDTMAGALFGENTTSDRIRALLH